MAQDFVALIEGRADLSKAKQDFDSFKKLMEQPIKITVDTSGFSAAWGNLQRQVQSLGAQAGKQYSSALQNNIKNVKIDPSFINRAFSGLTLNGKIDNGALMDYLGADVKLAHNLLEELAKINAEGGQLQKITFGNGGESFEAVIKNANTLVRVMGELENNQWVTSFKNVTTDLTSGIQQAQREADSLEQNIKKVMDAFSQGSFDKEMAKIQSSLANLGKDVDPNIAKKAFDKAIEYQRSTTAIRDSLNGTSANPLQGQDLVDMYSKAEVALRSFKNAMEELNAVAKANGVETGNSVKQAQTEAQKLTDELTKLGNVFSTGTFSANISKMEQGLMGISNSVSSDLVKKASDAAAEYYRITQEITNSINNPNQQGALQGQQLVDAYKQAEVALKTYNNAMKEVKSNTQKMLAEGEGARNANQVETWAKNNSKALKQYGNQLTELANKMRNAQTQGELSGYINQFKNLKAEITAAGLGGMSFGDQLKKAFVHIGEFTGIYALTSQLRQIPREMVQEVIKIDTAMTELRKVSTASASDISDYFDRATDSAYKYGQAINEVIDSTASWTRLGYNLDEAESLTNASISLARVGSGMDVNSSTSAIQSTIKGFGMAAEEAQRVADIVNYIADTEPIDAKGIGEGLTRFSSAMSMAGNTLEESIGLLTASTAVTQDPAKSANDWRTISMRIRGKILCLHTRKVRMRCCA